MLKTLRIQRFRGFRDLKLEGLGKVNLVVGRNNVGKSSLLEALHLYLQGGAPSVLITLLHARHELRPLPTDDGNPDVAYEAAARLFFNSAPEAGPILIGPSGSKEPLRVRLMWEEAALDPTEPVSPPTSGVQQPTLEISSGTQEPFYLDVAELGNAEYETRIRFRTKLRQEVVRVTPDGLSMVSMGLLWSRIALTAWEERILEALRVVEPEVERLAFIGATASQLVPVVKLGGQVSPVPLKSLGDGMNRVLGMMIALVSARGGVLLVDEIENGLHYSVQPDLWRVLLKLAEEQDVQVFATTHSWDCIAAFQAAVAERKGEQGSLIRLHRRNGDVEATVFGEQQLAVFTGQEIEVR